MKWFLIENENPRELHEDVLLYDSENKEFHIGFFGIKETDKKRPVIPFYHHQKRGFKATHFCYLEKPPKRDAHAK